MIRAPPRFSLLPEPEEVLPPPDVVALAERVLGRESPDYRALMVLAKPHISIREWCRELARSRAALYRRGARAAAAMAERLNEIETSKPAGRCL